MTILNVFLLNLAVTVNAATINEQSLIAERQKAWKSTQAECAVFCDKTIDLYDRFRILGVGALPRYSPPKIETNVNCFKPELICVNAFSYCDAKKVSTVEWMQSSPQKQEPKKLQAQCELKQKYGLILRAPIPIEILMGEGSFKINKLFYEGDVFYSNDKHYYKAVSGE